MSTAREPVPARWDGARDATFFALITDAFPTALITEATELMADDDGSDGPGDRNNLVPVRARLRSPNSL